MKKRKLIFLFCLISLFFIANVSAGFFGNFWNKFTGKSIDDLDMTPRIAIWAEKATQHTENGLWVTDPDGLAYAVISPDLNTEEYRLAFCRKYYGNSILSTREYKKEIITTWMSRWNRDGPYTSKDHVTYECVTSPSSGNSKLNISDENMCTFNCVNLGFECGGPMICGNVGLCGLCPQGQYCTPAWKCEDIKNNGPEVYKNNSSNTNFSCQETCFSLGYECGFKPVCGNVVNCGDCSENQLCGPTGKCMMMEFENSTDNNFTQQEDFLNLTQNFSKEEKEEFCYDTCFSLGYECGSHLICGVETECGFCQDGINCDWSGKCSSEKCFFGCSFNDKCVPIGMRKVKSYCSSELIFKEQLEKDNLCVENYECKSNLCLDGKCEKRSFFGRILELFR